MLYVVLGNGMNALNHILEFSILSVRIITITTVFADDEIPTYPVKILDFAEVPPWQKRKNTAAQSVPGG